ncbi:MAG: RusA family crossover junction endodeoxyribonuclease [Candidatus Scalindua sp.]|nr:RusA family crossover junction endodeoxyribonuclease [Candidatus Scalindua sp.]
MLITLPKPPSVNSMYRHNGNHTYITPDGVAWRIRAGYALNAQYKKKTPLRGDLSVYVTLYICGRGDIDNFNKGLLDLFTKHEVWEDDSQIVFLQLQKIKVKHRTDEKVEVEIDC